MKIRCQSASAKSTRSDLVIGFAFDAKKPNLGGSLEKAVAAAKATGDLKTSARKFSRFHPGSGNVKRIGFVGMGKAKGVDTEGLRRAAAVAQAQAEEIGVTAFDLRLVDTDIGSVDPFAAGAAVAEGLVLGAYRYQPPRKDKPEARKAQSATVTFAGSASAAFQKGFKFGSTAAAATVFTRDIENRAGNLATPTMLAAAAKKMAGPRVKVKILEESDMKRLKMEALLGVSRGSVEPAKLIVLDYNPTGAKRTVCVVGKGLTFDTGGISIKPSSKMDEMRYDMCGGGAVLGLFDAISKGALGSGKGKCRVVGIVPASENMPDADAQKPGDIVRACDGTTIEVLNTDAEGRLILADALAYAIKTYKPERVVDLATLTGAVIVALGHEVAAAMGNDDKLCEQLIAAGKAADEPLWQLPLWETHREQCKSKFADIGNINSPAHGNGSINGGAFLSYFVGDTSWVHLDIAGTAWGGKAKDYHRTGASGTAVRTLLHWVRNTCM